MWTVYLKEMLELLRDRKTFIFTVLIPVFAMPAIFGGLGYASSALLKNAQKAELRYAVFGKQNAPQLAARLAAETGFREIVLPDPASIKDAIAQDRIKFALVIPDGFETALASQRQASIALHYNNASTTDQSSRRVHALVDAHNASLREGVLSALGLSTGQLKFALNPITIKQHSTANQREQMGALVGGFLPYILLMVCLLAAMYPAIDLGAGEKERGTLETLLLVPLPRGTLVLAKFLVLFTVGLTSSALMVASIGVLLAVFGSSLDGDMAVLVQAIGAGDLAMVMLMLAPVAAIFSSILLSVSIYARSYKEASGMISPLMIVAIIPVLVAMLPGVEMTWLWAMVPLTNVSLAMKELVKGTMDYRMFSVILLSTTVVAGAMLAWCSWWFKREQVLFRD